MLAAKSVEENKKTRLQGNYGKKNMSYSQVKQEVVALVNKGNNYREIAAIKFLVDGDLRSFNISRISRWVKESRSENNATHDELSNIESSSSKTQVSSAFELFENGKGPIEAVVELKLDPEEAKEYYQTWKEMKAEDLSSKSVPSQIASLEDRIQNLEFLSETRDQLVFANTFFTKLNKEGYKPYCPFDWSEMIQTEKFGDYVCTGKDCEFRIDSTGAADEEEYEAKWRSYLH